MALISQGVPQLGSIKQRRDGENTHGCRTITWR